VKDKVKPKRDLLNRESYRKRWWQFAERCANLYVELSPKDYCFVTSRVTKYLGFSLVNTNCIFSDAVVVINENQFCKFSIIQSCLHFEWSLKLSSGLGNTIRYTPTDCFETFPFPQYLSVSQEQKLEQIGEIYHEFRRQLMLKMQLGLTKTYNAFHAREINAQVIASLQVSLSLNETQDKKTIEKKYGKEVWNLWNHLQKHNDVCSIEEAISGIIELRRLHVLMDEAVLEAYGWQLPSPQGEGSGVRLSHDFYEVDYLPENDRVRYTIHPEARKEILKRLLELNHKIHAEEVEAGLWDKKKTSAKSDTKNKVKYEIKTNSEVLGEPKMEFE